MPISIHMFALTQAPQPVFPRKPCVSSKVLSKVAGMVRYLKQMRMFAEFYKKWCDLSHISGQRCHLAVTSIIVEICCCLLC